MTKQFTLRTMVWLGLVAAPFLASPGRADILRLDPESTQVKIHLGTTFHEVEGSFDFLLGEVCFDPASGEADGEIVIDSTSGSTENKKRDRKMHRQVLESLRFPRIVFHPRRFDGVFHPEGSSEVVLRGTIELHGVSHEVEIPATVQTAGNRLTGTGRLTIPYVDWGMKDPSVFMFRAQKEVDILLDLAGSVSPGPIGPGCKGFAMHREGRDAAVQPAGSR